MRRIQRVPTTPHLCFSYGAPCLYMAAREWKRGKIRVRELRYTFLFPRVDQKRREQRSRACAVCCVVHRDHSFLPSSPFSFSLLLTKPPSSSSPSYSLTFLFISAQLDKPHLQRSNNCTRHEVFLLRSILRLSRHYGTWTNERKNTFFGEKNESLINAFLLSANVTETEPVCIRA